MFLEYVLEYVLALKLCIIAGIFAGLCYDFLEVFFPQTLGCPFEFKRNWPILIFWPAIATTLLTIAGAVYLFALGIFPL